MLIVYLSVVLLFGASGCAAIEAPPPGVAIASGIAVKKLKAEDIDKDYGKVSSAMYCNIQFANETAKQQRCLVSIFSGGSFIQLSRKFRRLDGVLHVQRGYTGGFTQSPITYEQVCRGLTGHAEAVMVFYNREVINFRMLLQAFYAFHDPNTMGFYRGKNRTLVTGRQFRSAVFARHHVERSQFREFQQNIQNITKHPLRTILYTFTGRFYAETKPVEELRAIRNRIHQRIDKKIEGLVSSKKITGNLTALQERIRLAKLRYATSRNGSATVARYRRDAVRPSEPVSSSRPPLVFDDPRVVDEFALPDAPQTAATTRVVTLPPTRRPLLTRDPDAGKGRQTRDKVEQLEEIELPPAPRAV